MNLLNMEAAVIVKHIFLSGAVINSLLVIIGSLLGLLFKKGIPDRIKDALMKGIALCVLYIGITGLFQDDADIIVIIVSVTIGSIIGELLDLDKLVCKIGDRLEAKLCKNGSTKIAEGFVTATLLFCVGAMSIVGSINSGLSNDNSTLYSKSVIDAISAVALSSSLGIGVMFSAIPVLFLEGVVTLFAVVISPILTTEVVAQMSIIGSMLIIALAFNMLKITNIKVMNYIPAIFLPILLCIIF